MFFGKSRAVAGIFEGLPDDIATGVVKFVLNDDQIAIFIECQQIQSFTGIVEAIEFFLDDQQFFPQGGRRMSQPFLQMVTLGKAEFGELRRVNFNNPIGGLIDLIHGPSLRLCLREVLEVPK